MPLPLEHFYKWERETPANTYFKQPIQDQWHVYSYEKAGIEIRKVAAAIRALDLAPGSNIAILSKNCAHWIMADLAIWMAGHVSVPLYPTLTADSIELILDHCEAKAIFIGKLDNYERQRDGMPSTLHKFSFPFYGIQEGAGWDDLLSKHSPLTGAIDRSGDELATIMYTSGTTGQPKGVMLSFEKMSFVVESALKGFKLVNCHERFISYLPLSHIAERNLVEMGATFTGATIYFSESLDKFPDNLMTASPTVFLAVPRIWSKFQEKILQKMPQSRLNTLLAIPLVKSIIKSTIKKKLGLTKARWILSGAAPMSIPLLEWYSKLGIVIHEVYGMTENQALSHMNLDEVKFGTVGKAWPEVEVKFSEAGEILTRHDGQMIGYYKEPSMTKDMFTPDGFLKTGDEGKVDADGFLTITGRVKDLFKTDKGKYIAPSPIELKVSVNPDVEQVCVVGMGVPQPIALITLSLLGKSKSKVQLKESLSSTLEHVNKDLQSYEKLEKAVVLREDWTIENGLMTPSLKVKRNELERLHVPTYPTWYKEEGVVVWE